MLIGFNLTFGPMHWLGLQGQVRRTWVYAEETNLQFWNVIVTIGAFTIAISIIVFMINWIFSKRNGEKLHSIHGMQEQLNGQFLLQHQYGTFQLLRR